MNVILKWVQRLLVIYLETFRKIFIKTINKRLNIIDTRKATNPSQRKVRKARINELVLIKQRFEKEFKQKLVSE